MTTAIQDALAALWRSEKPALSITGSAKGADLQERLGVDLPAEFVEYISEAAPQADWMDDHGFIWWAPDRMRTLREECGYDTPADQKSVTIDEEAHQYVVFADYLDWCYAYAVCCSNGPNRGRVALIGSQPDRVVANALSTFIGLVAADSDRVHSTAGDHFTDVL